MPNMLGLQDALPDVAVHFRYGHGLQLRQQRLLRFGEQFVNVTPQNRRNGPAAAL